MGFFFHETSACALLTKSVGDKLMVFFFYFSQKIGFVISCIVKETACMKCQNLLLGKIGKLFQKSYEIFTQYAKFKISEYL